MREIDEAIIANLKQRNKDIVVRNELLQGVIDRLTAEKEQLIFDNDAQRLEINILTAKRHSLNERITRMEYVIKVHEPADNTPAVKMAADLDEQVEKLLAEKQAQAEPEPTDSVWRRKAERLERNARKALLQLGESEESIRDAVDPVFALCVIADFYKAEISRLTAEKKAKDELLRDVLRYGEEGLTIDEAFANRIEQALKGEQEG